MEPRSPTATEAQPTSPSKRRDTSTEDNVSEDASSLQPAKEEHPVSSSPPPLSPTALRKTHAGDKNENLVLLRNILITYTVYNFELGKYLLVLCGWMVVIC